MGAIVEIKYFNSFLLKNTIDEVDTANPVPAWNGSWGVPAGVAGHYPVFTTVTQAES